MAGWDGLAGALTPLVGASPTNSGFLAADFDRGLGLRGDGSSKYLDSGRAGADDLQDDCHAAVFVQVVPTNNARYLGAVASTPTRRTVQIGTTGGNDFHALSNGSDLYAYGDGYKTGLLAASRENGSGYTGIRNGSTTPVTASSTARIADNVIVFGENAGGVAASFTNATLSFYSIGSATDLALLDTRVSQLMADLRAIEEGGFDADAVAYIRNVETADGAYLETSVKTSINRLVVGLKKDGLWESMKASCLLCGPRTLAGALVPLRGGSPVAYNFVSGDFDRIGLQGNATNTFINANYLNSASPQNDVHYAVYQSTPATTGVLMGSGGASSGANNLWEQTLIRTRCQSGNIKDGASVGSVAGFLGMSRSSSTSYNARYGGVADSHTDPSSAPGDTITTVFARGTTGGGRDSLSDAKISFYSIGTSLTGDAAGLALLDSHVSNYVTAIGASV